MQKMFYICVVTILSFCLCIGLFGWDNLIYVCLIQGCLNVLSAVVLLVEEEQPEKNRFDPLLWIPVIGLSFMIGIIPIIGTLSFIHALLYEEDLI